MLGVVFFLREMMVKLFFFFLAKDFFEIQCQEDKAKWHERLKNSRFDRVYIMYNIPNVPTTYIKKKTKQFELSFFFM